MARPRNPLADPVTVDKDHRVWWYKSARAGDGPRGSRRCGSAEEAKRFADEKRSELTAVRAARREEALPWPLRPISDSFDAWLADLDQHAPKGTYNTYRSKIDCYGYLIGGNSLAQYGIDLYSQVIELAAATDKKAVLEGVRTALNSWTWWAIDEKHLAATAIAEAGMKSVYRSQKHKLDRRLKERALAEKSSRRSTRGASTDSMEVDDDGHVGIYRAPSLGHVEALGRAIEERESKGDPGGVGAGRDRGGARRLDPREAWRLGRSIPFAAASGARECELLVAHTGDIDLTTGEWRIRGQLDRYSPWEPGEPPPLVPPKHDSERTTRFFKFYLPEVAALCAYADEHHGGYLFAPTRKQLRWAEAWEKAVERGVALLRSQLLAAQDTGAEPPLQWTWRRHYTRHHYGSWALAPVSVRGLGWTEQATQQRMGHSSPKVTRDLYLHLVEDEDVTWRNSDHRPGEVQ